jgi:hypothetical protein
MGFQPLDPGRTSLVTGDRSPAFVPMGHALMRRCLVTASSGSYVFDVLASYVRILASVPTGHA